MTLSPEPKILLSFGNMREATRRDGFSLSLVCNLAALVPYTDVTDTEILQGCMGVSVNWGPLVGVLRLTMTIMESMP